MRIGLKKLAEAFWFPPIPDLDPEAQVAIVPAMAAYAMEGITGATDPKLKAARICRFAFTDFRGFTEDDGTAIPNTVENRIALYMLPQIAIPIDNEIMRLSGEAIQGEDDAACD